MPKRMLDDSFLTSPSLAKCSPRAQDAFPRFILLADDFGCFEALPRVLAARGWPHRTDVTDTELAGWLEEYVAAGMACLWTVNERRYCYLTGWHGEHGQKHRDEYHPEKSPKGSKRRTPAPPADLVEAVRAGARRDHDGKPPGTCREMTGNGPGNGREGIPNDSVPARESEVSRQIPARVSDFPAAVVAGAGAVVVPDAVVVEHAGDTGKQQPASPPAQESVRDALKPPLVVDLAEIPDEEAATAKAELEARLRDGYGRVYEQALHVSTKSLRTETIDAWTQAVRRFGRPAVVAACYDAAGDYWRRKMEAVESLRFFLPTLKRLRPETVVTT